MADRVVERLVTGIGFAVDKASASTALKVADRMERRFQGVASAAKIMGATLAGAFAALAAGSVAISHDIVRQRDYARSLGTTVEQWTAWEHVATSSRLEAQDFRAGLISLTGAIEQAGSGSEDTQKLFKRLGVEWATADGKLRTSLELLPELADGLNALGEGDRAAALVRIFGEDDGVKMFDLLSKGSAGMRKLRDEAAGLGVVIDQQTAQSALRLQGSLTRLRAAIRGAGLQLFREVGPTFERLAEGLADLATRSDSWVRIGLDGAIRRLGIALRGLESPAGQAAAALLAVGAIFVGAQATLSVPILGQVSGALIGVSRGLLAVTSGALGLLGIPFAPFAAAVAGVAAAVGLLYLAWDEFMVTAQGGDSLIRRLADQLGVGSETAALFAAVVDNVNAKLEEASELGQFFFGTLSFGVGVLQTGASALWEWSRALASIVIPAPLLRLVDALLGSISPTEALRALITGTTGAVQAETARTRGSTATIDAFGGGQSASSAFAEREYQAGLARQAVTSTPQAALVGRKADFVGGAVSNVTQTISVNVGGAAAGAEQIATAVGREVRRAAAEVVR